MKAKCPSKKAGVSLGAWSPFEDKDLEVGSPTLCTQMLLLNIFLQQQLVEASAQVPGLLWGNGHCTAPISAAASATSSDYLVSLQL